MSFTTLTVPPSITASDASDITTDSANLNSDLATLGTASSVDVSFEWGIVSGGPYPNQTVSQTKATAGIGSIDLSGLTPGTTYYFRAKAVGHGTSYGSEGSFTTLTTPPSVTNSTSAATDVTIHSATLSGDLTSLGTASAGKVSFEWGTTPGGPYPNETDSQILTDTGFFSAGLTGLEPNTTYYFRIKADGGTHGSTYGDEGSLTTPAEPFNRLLLWSVIGGVVVLGLIIFLVRRRQAR